MEDLTACSCIPDFTEEQLADIRSNTVAIVAMDRNNVIGNGLNIPWKLRDDMRFFKETTINNKIIMGRKTWDSLRGTLPDRMNIVISRTDSSEFGKIVHLNIESFLEISSAFKGKNFIIGGGEIYRLGMRYCGELIITHVDAKVEGDITFPKLDPTVWEAAEVLLTRDPSPPMETVNPDTGATITSPGHKYGFTIVRYVRRK